MAKKTRVYELARELGKSSREVLDLLADSGVRDKNHMSALDDNVVRFIKNKFAEREGKTPEAVVDKSVSQEVEEPPSSEEETRTPKQHERKAQARRAPGMLRGTKHPTASADFKRMRSQMPSARSGTPSSARRSSRVSPDSGRRYRNGNRKPTPRAGGRPPDARHRQRPRQWPTQIAPTIPPRGAAGKGKPQADAIARSRAARARQADQALREAKKLEAQNEAGLKVVKGIEPTHPPVDATKLEVKAEAVETKTPVPSETGVTAPKEAKPAAPAEEPKKPVETHDTVPVTRDAQKEVEAEERIEPEDKAKPKEPVVSHEPKPKAREKVDKAVSRQAVVTTPEVPDVHPDKVTREKKREREQDKKPEAPRAHRPAARKPAAPKPTDERRLELIKGGKGAAKLRESRREAIIRSRKGFRGREASREPVREAPARRRSQALKKSLIALPESITVGALAERLSVNPSEIIKTLMAMGLLVTINQEVEFDAASLVAEELGFEVEPLEEKEAREFGIEDRPDADEDLLPRPPVVTVLGHVDHGKTSLLDAIRQTNVTSQEAGGITQHIGAYQIELNERKITFIDTPGHEAFTAMRARGAQVTDIAILVVAADDGVMPQTVEAINHAKAANVPIIVAVNKVDKPDAQPERVKQQLTEYGLVSEDWGGDTVTVEVSALRRQGIEDLLEMVLLVADLKELKANPDRLAKGTVIEAKLDKGKGPVAAVLIERGTLRIGDSIVAGGVSGRVKAMSNDQGEPVEEAGPSMPVEILGFAEVPQAGDIFNVVSEDRLARQLASRRSERKRAEEIQSPRTISLDDLFGKIREGEIKELNLIIKADVQGSVEALRQSLEALSTDEVRVNVIHAGVGAITESDVMLASASNAIIIGFQVRPDGNAKAVAERDQIDIRLYRVIYDATDDIKAAMEGLLEPETREVELGAANVLRTFKVPKVGMVAGCIVNEGKITRDAMLRVIRDNIVIHEGKLASLKRFKDDVAEVASGYECGIGIASYQDIREGDVIEAFKIVETRREL
ncbi:MAG: translation initiation factor IF-2 [Firmicutes bacterium]|nr:translation initiation factor IF-2 [Bacillota bacterium]